MKKKFFLIISLLLVMIANRNEIRASEIKRYEKQILDSLNINGRIMIDDTKICDSLLVKGTVLGQESTMKNIHIVGQAELKNCIITGKTNIIGCLSADKTLFQDEIVAESQKITFSACSLHSIRVKKVEGYEGPQIIDLKNGTQVLGPIIVESGFGEVWISSDSEITTQIEGVTVRKK